jgi:hypothetical protein
MTPLAAVTIGAAGLGLVAFIRTVYVLLEIGSDSFAAGPWRRPEPTRRPTRLPADFIGLWSLFGQRSMRDYAGSWEAAVSRLDRLEASLLEDQPERANQAPSASPVPPPSAGRSRRRVEDPAEEWLHRRLDRLESLAGLSTPASLHDSASERRP